MTPYEQMEDLLEKMGFDKNKSEYTIQDLPWLSNPKDWSGVNRDPVLIKYKDLEGISVIFFRTEDDWTRKRAFQKFLRKYDASELFNHIEFTNDVHSLAHFIANLKKQTLVLEEVVNTTKVKQQFQIRNDLGAAYTAEDQEKLLKLLFEKLDIMSDVS